MQMIFRKTEISSAAAWLLGHSGSRKCFAFYGEMGAGKTTLISSVCSLLGVASGQSSPTFSIINEYRTKHGEPVFHMDFYRLKDEAAAIQVGVEDCLYSGHYCFVEWPEKAPGILPSDTIHVYVGTVDNETRNLKLKL